MKENQDLNKENENLREQHDILTKENLALIQKNHQTLDSEIYVLKIKDLEKQNQYLFTKLQEKNKELMEMTEKAYNINKKNSRVHKELEENVPLTEKKIVK